MTHSEAGALQLVSCSPPRARILDVSLQRHRCHSRSPSNQGHEHGDSSLEAIGRRVRCAAHASSEALSPLCPPLGSLHPQSFPQLSSLHLAETLN